MRVLLTITLLTVYFFGSAQVSLQALSLNKGRYYVGFRHYIAYDSTRTYKRSGEWSNKSIYRPIPVSVWYPRDISDKTKSLTVLDYMHIFKEEAEWEYLPDYQILDWFGYPDTPENRAHFREATSAFEGGKAAKGKYPAIVYAPSFQASSIENFALCEYLASYGYIVIASPSRGAETRSMGMDAGKDMETQARDIEFLIKEIIQNRQADMEKLATIGFSFGGLSNILTQMRNNLVKAIISLDGSIKYQYTTLKKSPYYKIEKTDVPFIHMAQKNIPPEVLAEDKIDSSLNHAFDFYDDLLYSKAYSFKFHDLTHMYFSTLGILFQERDKRQDKTDKEIMESYRLTALYALNFLNAFLKNDRSAHAFLEETPENNGIPAGLISKKSKQPRAKEMSFEDFNGLMYSRQYKNLDPLYDSLLAVNTRFKPEEGKLNNLGLQLLFNTRTSQQGISVLELATKIYPQSANLFDSLAEAYFFVGDTISATENFKQSLTLDPQNQNAIKKLRLLEK
ncbi:MAG: prolyl oligopeptidase family serine peptidase [Chitinophagaceae bacterium]